MNNPYQKYEMYKRRLLSLGLDSKQFQEVLKIIAEVLKI